MRVRAGPARQSVGRREGESPLVRYLGLGLGVEDLDDIHGAGRAEVRQYPAQAGAVLVERVRRVHQAALERFSTGLAAELYDDDIAVNALSPTRVVPTPGTIFHHLTSQDDPNSEPPSVMAEAALRLCSAEPKALTGRIAYSQELLAELAASR